MNITHFCILTDDVSGLVAFYEKVFGRGPDFKDAIYAEFRTEKAKLAVFSVSEHNKRAPGTAECGANRSVILEIHVRNVDEEYEKIRAMGAEIAKEPTTQPWGIRSFYFRDPDGNLVSFYTPIKEFTAD